MSQVLLLNRQASLQQRGQSRIRPDLTALGTVMASLGEPQLSYPSVLITGTNGKGSTAAMLAAMLSAHGLRTGLYTSPHLLQVEERVRIDGAMIEADELGRHLADLERYPELTYFETVTAAAWLCFAEHQVDVAVLEAGMGGRWDATRLAASAVAGLTNVGTDHRHWLGQTRQEIAGDKGQALAGARRGVLGPGISPDLLPHLGAPAAVASGDLIEVMPLAEGRVEVSCADFDGELTVPLNGTHQVANLHLALALARAAVELGWLERLQLPAVARGLAAVTWPGRLSRLLIGGREVLLDGAHNLESAQALAAYLASRPEPYNLLFSCLDDKPVDKMAAVLRPHVAEVVVCELADERAMPLPRLSAAFAEASTADSPVAGLTRLAEPVLAAGSLRLIGALMAAAEVEG